MSASAEAHKEALEAEILSYLAKNDKLENSLAFVQNDESKHLVFVGVMNSLLAISYIQSSSTDKISYRLTQEGNNYRTKGSPEGQIFAAVTAEGVTKADLAAQFGALLQIGLNACMKNGWLLIDKTSGLMKRKVDTIKDETQLLLQGITDGSLPDAKVLDSLVKRSLVSQHTTKVYTLTKGPKFSTVRKALATDLTTDMLKSGEWEHSEFKDYILAKGPDLKCGSLHPLMKVRAQFRSILMEMGFEEMPTNNFVESSFWNFDSLFQPQQHPARDAHDTFFIRTPELSTQFPADYLKRVKATHENGGDTGSIGYRYDWKIEEAQKNILRTHTTAVSSRMLYKLAQGPFEPKKYFSIDRVFRNETLDATHLAEFHQVEGLVADRNLTLGDLIGVIQTFFKKIGIDDVRFKPAYNPYTEPSMEIFGWSKERNKWMEIGNSGMFRPEMLQPMGLPSDVRVIAWGLSLERPTMIKYGLGNIRELFGPKVRLEIIEKNPICRYP
jgi:phenylalanyl-tRNA synthetase alpha chain